MMRWMVRALLVVTLLAVVTLAVDSGRHGGASAARLVVDEAAQPAHPQAKPAAPENRQASSVADSAACADVAVTHEIIVDIHTQELWACAGQQLLLSTKVTTGAVNIHEATPDGTWQIYAKQTHRWLSGPGYSVEVNFWMPFFQGYGIHDAPWQKFPFGSSKYRAQGSHGCVQVPTTVMARLFSWAPVGATVHVED